MSDVELPVGMPKWVADHVKLYLEDPEAGHLWDASLGGGSGMLPTLLLFTTGRRSGKQRVLPLIYRQADDHYVIIASKGGAPKHPGWYLNLVAEPECEIQVGPQRMRARARTAEDAQRQDLWDKLVEIYAPYAEYQQRAGDREIPVVVLDVS